MYLWDCSYSTYGLQRLEVTGKLLSISNTRVSDYFNPTVSYISVPASHLYRQSLGWLCIIVRSMIYHYDPATKVLIFIIVNTAFTQGQGRGTCKLISEPVYFIRFTIYHDFNPFILSGSQFTPWPYPSISTEVTINPLRFTDSFLLLSRPLFTLGSLACAMIQPTL